MVEHSIGNGEVIGSIPIVGSILCFNFIFAKVAQLVEHSFRKAGVVSSILTFGSDIFAFIYLSGIIFKVIAHSLGRCLTQVRITKKTPALGFK